MTRSDLVEKIVAKSNIPLKDVDAAAKIFIDEISAALSVGKRVELRGFGIFEPRQRSPRVARNPKTGSKVVLSVRRHVHFKMGKELRERVNNKSSKKKK
jgi:integration host factor subunit beta